MKTVAEVGTVVMVVKARGVGSKVVKHRILLQVLRALQFLVSLQIQTSQ